MSTTKKKAAPRGKTVAAADVEATLKKVSDSVGTDKFYQLSAEEQDLVIREREALKVLAQVHRDRETL